MKFAFMHEHRQVWKLSVMAHVLGVSRQGYHSWAVRQPSKREMRHRDLRVRIRSIYDQSNGTYGSPRVTSELRQGHGLTISKKTIEGLIRQEGLCVRTKRRFRPTTDSSKTLAPAPNRLERSFDTSVVNHVWLSDFTEIPCREVKAYAVAIMDMASRRIIGLNVFHRMHTGSLMIALHRACKLRKTFPRIPDSKPIIFHSDRGTQYNSQAFRDALARHGIVQSMSGVGNCYDNAPMESLWARMKTELAFYMPFRDPDDAARHVYRYFHVYYNRKRRHSGIGNISPVEFEGRYIRSIRHSL